MAGRGSRLRPHTLTVPKPLVPVAGKPIVQRIVEDLAASVSEPIEEIAFITGDFGKQVEQDLVAIAEAMGAKGSIYKQTEPLGTAHAILCAKPSLTGNLIVAFADTLFQANFDIDLKEDGMIWVKQVEDPSAFGVIKVDSDNVITDFVEKPTEFVSDMAIVGIYYVREGEQLRDEMQYLIDNDIKEKGEYQLTNALENLKAKGTKFKPAILEEWLDCGNKAAVVYSNERILDIKKDKETLVHDTVKTENAVIIEPCFIGANTVIKNAVVGPYVSIGHDCVIENSRVENSVIQNETHIQDANLRKAMIGSKVVYDGKAKDLSIGDFSVV